MGFKGDETRRVIPVGSPDPATLDRAFRGQDWQDVRLDIDPAAKRDITASTADMAAIVSGVYDAVYSSRKIEHLCAHEAPLAWRAFARVLEPAGFALIRCADLRRDAGRAALGHV